MAETIPPRSLSERYKKRPPEDDREPEDEVEADASEPPPMTQKWPPVLSLARATPRWGHGMGNWLIERFTLLGVTFQNWVILALAVILVGALIAWWRGQ
jgi:hypothetical protein